MIENVSIGMVSSVGFPIVMCFYLVTRFEKKLEENTQAIKDLTYSLRNNK